MDTANIAKRGLRSSTYKAYSSFVGFEILAAVIIFWDVSGKLTAPIFRKQYQAK
jgi:hypothetical protein